MFYKNDHIDDDEDTTVTVRSIDQYQSDWVSVWPARQLSTSTTVWRTSKLTVE